MYSLARLTLAEMAHATTRLRKLGESTHSFEGAAQKVAQFLFDEFGDPTTAERGTLLARVYKTHALGGLPPDLQEFARKIHPQIDAQTRCLVLMSSVGADPRWNDRRSSRGHQAIPLPSPEAIERLPMVAALLTQLGVNVGKMLSGGSVSVLDEEEKTFNVFHVPEARGSPHIPAQKDFVEPHGVRSVLGCGGQLPDGQLYAAILFSKLPIGAETANTFRPLTLAIKLALIRHANGNLFDAPGARS